MAAQTKGTVTDWGQQRINPQSAQTLAAWAATTNPLALDLLQIYSEGGDVVVNVTSTGVVHNPASSPTSQCLFGRYYTRLASSASTAAVFADVFSQNNAQQDVMQLIGQGDNGIWHLDYTGTAFSS